MLNIIETQVQSPQKVVIYAPEGFGKTMFAHEFPSPLFIDLEGACAAYGYRRTTTPLSWEELLAQVADVAKEQPCATLVIDSADWAEQLCIAHVCNRDKKTSIEDWGYGKGYTIVVEEWCRLLDALTNVVDAGMNVVLTAHAAVRRFDQPDEAASYNRWALALIDAPKMSSAAKTKEWADAVLFGNFKTIVEVVGEGSSAKGKARGGEKRVLYTQHHACWDAKNRWGLPAEVPFAYSSIAAYIPQFQGAVVQPVSAPISEAPVTISPESVAKANEFMGLENTPMTTSEVTVQRIERTEAPVVPAQPEPQYDMQLPEFWKAALSLMERDFITMNELRDYMARKGHFPAEMPPENIPVEYIEGAVVANWPAIKADIEATRAASEPLPFS